MSYSITRTATFNRSHARHVATKMAADLRASNFPQRQKMRKDEILRLTVCFMIRFAKKF